MARASISLYAYRTIWLDEEGYRISDLIRHIHIVAALRLAWMAPEIREYLRTRRIYQWADQRLNDMLVAYLKERRLLREGAS